MKFSDIIKDHWYLITMTIIGIIFIVLTVIGSFMYNKGSSQLPSPSNKKTCTLNNNSYITDINIGQNKTINDSNFYCPSGTSVIQLSPQSANGSLNDDLNGSPYVQLCATIPTNICDTDQIITDIKITDIQGDNKTWKPLKDRC